MKSERSGASTVIRRNASDKRADAGSCSDDGPLILWAPAAADEVPLPAGSSTRPDASVMAEVSAMSMQTSMSEPKQPASNASGSYRQAFRHMNGFPPVTARVAPEV